MDESQEWIKFLHTITQVEKNREFDRKVDRLKKSSSATTFWAVFGGILGIHGLAHFYLNRPIEGLVILVTGFIPNIFAGGMAFLFTASMFYPYGNYLPPSIDFDPATSIFLFTVLRLGFFVGNIISARYHYSRYDFYIHLKAKKPWNNWGLDSLI